MISYDVVGDCVVHVISCDVVGDGVVVMIFCDVVGVVVVNISSNVVGILVVVVLLPWDFVDKFVIVVVPSLSVVELLVVLHS